MKSRKVKAYQAHKRAKPDLVLDESDSDVNADSFLHDDIEDFNDEKDNELSTDDELIQHRDDSSEEEEVLPITDDEKEESDNEDILEKDDSEDDDDEEEEKGLPNRDAWGMKKSAYYSADFVDEDRGRTYREDDAEAARAEAEEAFAIQKSIYSGVKADNLGANLFLEGSEESSGEEEKVDIAFATKQEKMKYLKTETKVLEVCKEYKSAINEFKKFSTLSKLVAEKKILSKNLENYINTKLQILNLYGMNLSMYMVFISSGRNPKYHPVVQRISSIKQQLDELKPVDDIAAETIDKLYEKFKIGEEIKFCSESEVEDDVIESTIERSPKDSIQTDKEGKKVKKTKTKHVETENEKQVMSLIKEVKEELKKRKREDSDEEDEDMNESKPTTDQDENNTEEKRIISYEIAKNKGLVPHRKKEYRNPRVRHRMKFRKANIRRKGQVRGVVKEIKRYQGEPTGININVVKSVKFK